MERTTFVIRGGFQIGNISIYINHINDEVDVRFSPPPHLLDFVLAEETSGERTNNESLLLWYSWIRDDSFCLKKFCNEDCLAWNKLSQLLNKLRHKGVKAQWHLTLKKNSAWTVCFDRENYFAIGIGPEKFYYDILVNAVLLAYLRFTSVISLLLLHAAGVVLNDKCYLFLGKSGDGKTTLALNAKKDGLIVLSDDRIVVKNDKGNSVACGTPFGKVSDGPISYPIGSIIFLEKHESNIVKTLSRKEAFLKLWEEEFYHRYRFLRRGFARSLFEQIYNLTHSLPCFVLKFRKDFHDWELVCRAVYGSK